MSGNTDLESKTIEALRHYREAFATVENLEREEASARRALTSMLPDLECALLEDDPPSLKRTLLEIVSLAMLRSDEAWTELREATAKLDAAPPDFGRPRTATWIYSRCLDSPGRSGLASSRTIWPKPVGLLIWSAHRLVFRRAGRHRRPAPRRGAGYWQAPKVRSSAHAGGFRQRACS